MYTIYTPWLLEEAAEPRGTLVGAGPPRVEVLLDLGEGLGPVVVAAEHVDELALRVHDVEEDGVVDEVGLPRLHVGRRAEVHAVLLADVLDLLVRAR